MMDSTLIQDSRVERISQRAPRKRSGSKTLGLVVRHVVLIVGALFMVIPFVWMLLTTVKTLPDSVHVPPILLPRLPLQWHNYLEALQVSPFLHFYLNTILMTIGRTLGQLVFCSLAAYALACIKFRGRGVLFIAILALLMVPNQLPLVPQYLLMDRLGWLNNQASLIIPGMFSVFGTFLLRQFFMTLPSELQEAATLDGANHLQIFWHVLLPLVKPGLIALTIFTVLWSWNDLLWPLIVINSPERTTLSAGLAALTGQYITNYPVLMAGATLAIWPMILLFFFLQRHFVEGIAITGTKG